MGRRRKHDGDSGLASDQIPGQNQNNIRNKPCHSLLYHHQALRGDTLVNCTRRAEQMQAGIRLPAASVGRRIGNGALRKERNRVQAVEMQRGFSSHEQPDLPQSERLILH